MIFWVSTVLFLITHGAWAMWEEEEKNTASYVTQMPLRSTIITSDENYAERVSDDILIQVFTFLDVADLGRGAQVSTRWKNVGSDAQLWRSLGLRKYGDYLTQEDLRENPRQMVVQHYLSVLVNTETDLERIEMLVQSYSLGFYDPQFKKNINSKFLVGMVENKYFEELIAQGNPMAIGIRNKTLPGWELKGVGEELRKFSETLVKKGDLKAIMIKIERLTQKGYYTFERSIRWCGMCDYGGFSATPCHHCQEGCKKNVYKENYEKNPKKAREFIEDLIISEYPAVRGFGKYLKAFALKYGITALGYERDYEKAIEFIKQHNLPS